MCLIAYEKYVFKIKFTRNYVSIGKYNNTLGKVVHFFLVSWLRWPLVHAHGHRPLHDADAERSHAIATSVTTSGCLWGGVRELKLPIAVPLEHGSRARADRVVVEEHVARAEQPVELEHRE